MWTNLQTAENTYTVINTDAWNNTNQWYNHMSHILRNVQVENEGHKEENVKGVYHVFIIDPEIDDILYNDFIVAKNEVAAKVKAFISAELNGDFDYYEINTLLLFQFEHREVDRG